MFEIVQSIKVYFVLVRVGCLPRRCAAILPFFWEKHPRAQPPLLLSWTRRCGGWVRSDGYLSGLVRINIPKDSSRLILWVKCIFILSCVRCFPAFNCTQFHWRRRDGIDGFADWGVYSSSGWITANTLSGLGGGLRPLKLGGTIGCCLPKPYGLVDSLESDSIVTI